LITKVLADYQHPEDLVGSTVKWSL
jgi:hypothetical protein